MIFFYMCFLGLKKADSLFIMALPKQVGYQNFFLISSYNYLGNYIKFIV
jgi:hypothetical protein